MSRWLEERAMVLETGRRMLEKGLVVGSCGNVSLRLKEGLIAITPHGRYYDELEVEDIVVIDFEGENIEGELIPSVESLLHIEIYKARPEINAVIHTHSPFASAVSVAGLEIPPILDDQVAYIGGEIKLTSYFLPGSLELVGGVLSALEERNVALIANHGVVGVGRDLKHAFIMCELAEKTAKVFIYATLLGNIHQLNPGAVEVLKSIFMMSREEVR